MCSFSIWAETYSYTLTEEIASGIPVLSFDIGAVSQRIKKSGCGYIISLDSTPEQILEKIDDIFKNKKNTIKF